MVLTGTIVNAASVLAGGILGTMVGDKISERYKTIVMQVLCLSVAIMGIGYALKPKNMMVVIVCLVIGSIIGETIDLDKRLLKLGKFLETKFSSKEGFSKGFITTTLVFCVGSMAIMGSLNSGLKNDHDVLFVKSILDGISSIMFASTFGIGVAFTSASIFIYQGSIALLAGVISPYVRGSALLDLTAVGGILILGLAFDMLEIKKIKVANMLPAIFLPVFYYAIIKLF